MYRPRVRRPRNVVIKRTTVKNSGRSKPVVIELVSPQPMKQQNTNSQKKAMIPSINRYTLNSGTKVANHPQSQRLSGPTPFRGIDRDPVQKKPAMRAQQPLNLHHILDDCTKLFIKARTDPFGIFPTPPCNPMSEPVDSIKFRSYKFGTFVTGLNGNGFVAVTHLDPINDNYSICYTNNTWNDSTNLFDTVAAGGVISYDGFTDSPIDNMGGVLDGSYKIVGLGLRVCDIGTTLETSGIICRWNAPSNEPTTSVTITAARGNAQSKTVNIQQQHCYETFFTSAKIDDDNLQYRVIPINETTVGLPSGATMAFGVLACKPGRAFNYEIAAWYEWVPSASSNKLKGLVTRSEGSTSAPVVSQTLREVRNDHIVTAQGSTKRTIEKVAKKVHSEADKKDRIVKANKKKVGPVEGIVDKIPLVGGALGDVVHEVESNPLVSGLEDLFEGFAF